MNVQNSQQHAHPRTASNTLSRGKGAHNTHTALAQHNSNAAGGGGSNGAHGTSQMLDRFAQAHGVEPATILGSNGSNKRPSSEFADPRGVPSAEQSAVDVNTTNAATNDAGISAISAQAPKRARGLSVGSASDSVLAGMASARQTPLSILADALGTCLQEGSAVGGTQFCSQGVLAQPPLLKVGGVPAERSAVQAARSRRRARLHAQVCSVCALACCCFAPQLACCSTCLLRAHAWACLLCPGVLIV